MAQSVKISIVSINRERFPEPVLPLGAAAAAGVLRAEGHEVRVLDLCHAEAPDDAIVSHLGAFEPDLIGISLRNLENNQMLGNRSFLDEAKRVVERVRSASSSPILLGGAGYSLFPGEFLEALGVSYGLAGEAEQALPALVRCIARGDVPRGVPGACYRGPGERIVSDAARARDFPADLLPAFDLIDCATYAAQGAAIPFESKRGCNLACSFCPESADREGARLKPVGQAVDEIERAVGAVGTRRLFFTDGVFHHPPAHALALCREIARRRLDLRWSAGVNPAGLSRELLEAMKEAGCVGVGLGLDAVTDRMLRSYRKGFDREDVERAMRDLREVGIPFAVFMLFGGPGETRESVSEALATLDALIRDEMVFLAMGLRVFKGTPLEAIARSEGRIEPGHDMLSPTYYLSSELDETLLEALEAHCADRPHWFTLPTLANLSPAELAALFRR
jgi:radical SAM superfamily enzyme YgiQ (UPF0313 family)